MLSKCIYPAKSLVLGLRSILSPDSSYLDITQVHQSQYAPNRTPTLPHPANVTNFNFGGSNELLSKHPCPCVVPSHTDFGLDY